ncbi:MAG: hypothetical protein EA402_06120 [Planctomycetota bacterium]|nr:MAG: hypothetical protein EA402_06120 [Planctomycetota bacterium]
MQRCDLHRHLYGSVDPAWWLAHIAGQTVDLSAAEQTYFLRYQRHAGLSELRARQRRGDAQAGSDFARILADAHGASGFEAFQARHDLITWSSALADPQLLRRPSARAAAEIPALVAHVAERGRGEALALMELRVMLPALLRPAVESWLWRLISDACLKESQPAGRPQVRAVASLPRSRASAHWPILRDCLLAGEADGIVAVDFCHREEGQDPRDLLAFAAELHRFNAEHPRLALALLVHVGESFERLGFESALRRIHQVQFQLQPHRLGHACAAGLPLGYLRRQPRQRREAGAEWQRSRDWIASAAEQGFAAESARRLLNAPASPLPSGSVCHDYDQQRLEDVARLAAWLRQELAKAGAIIEVCPSSNRAILGLAALDEHPLLQFLDSHINCLIGSDDPALFATSLPQEAALMAPLLGDTQANALIERREWASEILSGRAAARSPG